MLCSMISSLHVNLYDDASGKSFEMFRFDFKDETELLSL